MPQFCLLACTDAEYAKADATPNYIPKEYQVDVIEAATENQARRMLAKGIRSGKYPKGTQMVEASTYQLKPQELRSND